MTQPTAPRRFHLIRREDETGVSGTGIIVEGLEFTDGTVSLRWLTGTTSTAIYASIDDVQAIHGHGGKTTVHWLDDGPPASRALRDAEVVRDRYGSLLRQFVTLTEALHVHAGRHDTIGADLRCGGCELADKAVAALRDAGATIRTDTSVTP